MEWLPARTERKEWTGVQQKYGAIIGGFANFPITQKVIKTSK